MNTPTLPLTCFTLTEANHVAHLVLNQPEAMNTMHPTFWRELDAVLTRLHKDGSARALVISSTGKHFSAGMALETFAGAIQMDDQSPEGRAAIFDLLGEMQATFTKLETLRMPVIAAIQGGCIGGAVDMVSACCIRYATPQTFFCIQEINIGLHGPSIGRRPRSAIRIGQCRVRHARGDAGSRTGVRRRDCVQTAHCHLGYQAGHPLHARPLGGRRAQADGLAAGCDLEQPPCDGSRDGHEDQAPGRLPCADNAEIF
jgi:enoyl-CoA hydratase/carnithine racemase